MREGSPASHQNKNRDREPALLVEKQAARLQQCGRVVPARLFTALTADAEVPDLCQTLSGAAFPP